MTNKSQYFNFQNSKTLILMKRACLNIKNWELDIICILKLEIWLFILMISISFKKRKPNFPNNHMIFYPALIIRFSKEAGWQVKGIFISLPTSIISSVILWSSLVGCWSPDGWLWTRIKLWALAKMADLITSLGWTRDFWF